MRPDLPPASVAWALATRAKAGNRPAENEDAAAADPAALRFAVADGASEGWRSGEWAERLAAAYVRRPPEPADFPDWLAEVRSGWTPPAARAAWYSEAKEAQGAFATLLGVSLAPRQSGWGWKAVAIGDSCLFVVRGRKLLTAFPVESADGFGSRPPLVGSSPDAPPAEPDWLAGAADPGDLLVLATDGVAAWLLGAPAKRTWPRLADCLGLGEAERREKLLELLAEAQAKRNDDATVIAVRVPEAAGAG